MPPSLERLILVRHGATALNRQRRYQGRLDHGLSVGGILQARGLAAALASLPRGAALWASDRRRALETAAIALPGWPARSDHRLRELDFGAFDGSTYDENAERHGRRFEDWVRDPDRTAPPGGETLDQLGCRVRSWRGEQAADDVVAFTHAGPIRVLIADHLGVPFADTWRWCPGPGQAVRLHTGREPRVEWLVRRAMKPARMR